MNPSSDHDRNEQKLEQLVQQTLRDLPGRRAPRTLEQRVLAEIGRRAALPWWHKSYAFWPAPVRALFFLVSAMIAAVAVAGLFALTRGATSTEAAGEIVSRLTDARGLLGTLVDQAVMLFYAIPKNWLYGGIAVVVASYLTLIGIGAFAYRTLRAHR